MQFESKGSMSGIGYSSEGQSFSIENNCNDREFDLFHSDEEDNSRKEEEWKTALKCPRCEEKYDNKTCFLDHLQSHKGKLKSCSKCHKVFQNSMTFKYHKRLYMCVKSSKQYQCKLCNKKLLGESQYNNHAYAHKRNQCQVCGDHFARRKHLEAHQRNIHKISPDKDLFSCHCCGKGFAQRRSLVYHYKITHPYSNLICAVCLEMFDSSSELETHQATHKQQTFTCEKCGEQFSRQQQYLVHLKQHGRFQCKTCEESFSAKKNALSHARQGHDVAGLDPQLQCAHCGQLFATNSLLKSHMFQHTGGDALTCEKCKITFKYERNYKSHLETNEHLRGEEPKNLFACEDCSKTFTNKNNLRVHVSRMHKSLMKEHLCTLCPYKTKLLNNFKRHVALHTDKPQFVCDLCGAQFQLKNALDKHLARRHTKSRDFSCDKCGKTFVSSSDLNRHLTNTHSDTPLHTCHCGNSYKSLSNLQRHQLLTHTKVHTKRAHLTKVFLQESDSAKKKTKKSKTGESFSNCDLNIVKSQMPPGSSTTIMETNTVIMVAEKHSQEILEVPYNIEFTSEKSQVVYAHNLDMNSFHVVESMSKLESEHLQEETGVLINVRNFLGQPLENNYLITEPLTEPSLENELDDSMDVTDQHMKIASQKQDVILELHQYGLPHDLNFLNL